MEQKIDKNGKKISHFDERQQYKNFRPTNDGIFYKGVNRSTLDLIRQSGEIRPRMVEKGNFMARVVYVTKSETLARQYGEIILKMNLSGMDVKPSPHSNQFVVVGSIPAERIIQAVENFQGANMQNQKNINFQVN